jgi:hypothetical protein
MHNFVYLGSICIFEGIRCVHHDKLEFEISDPIQLAYVAPFVFLLCKNRLKIFNLDTRVLKQEIDVLATNVASDNRNIVLASSSSVFLIIVASVLEIVNRLIQEQNYTEAISLLENDLRVPNETRIERLRLSRFLFAKQLFHSKQYKRSFKLFQESGSSILSILELYPTLRADFYDEKAEPESHIPEAYENLVLFLLKRRTEERTLIAKANILKSAYELVCIDTIFIIVLVHIKDHGTLRTFLSSTNDCDAGKTERILIKYDVSKMD